MKQVEIKFSGKLHKRILTAVNARKRLSRDKYRDRYDAWAEMEKEAVAYIKETAKDRRSRLDRDHKGIPTYTTIKVPFSQASYLTALTYWTSVFLSRDPVFQFSSRHSAEPGTTDQIEALVNYQISVGASTVPLYTWLSDVGKYGLGIVGMHWAQDVSTISTIEEIEEEVLGIPTGKTLTQRSSRRLTTYEGNRIYNVRPQDWFPDPRVSLARFQTGEYCGRYIEVGWNTLLKGAAAGSYFNLKEVKRLKGAVDPDRDYGSSVTELPNEDSAILSTDELISDVGTIPLTEMYIELVPRDWGLGQSDFPEKWVFTVARDHVVIGAQPLGELHDQFPFDILTYEIDAYSLYNRSMLEIAQPLNNTLTWLMNSHFYNIRKSLNDMFVVNGEKIEIRDLLNPEPGKIIRMLPGVGDADPRTAIAQLPVQNVTGTHLRDMQIVMDMMNRVLGVNDTVMGVQGTGRTSATEIRRSSDASINRLKTNAEYFSAQGFSPLGQKLVQSTQQHYTGEQTFRIAGKVNDKTTHLSVTPEGIAGAYDFAPVDGTLPIDRFAQANLWRQMMVDAASNPILAQQLDVYALFKQTARLQGVNNLDKFQVETGSTQDLAAQAQAGDIQPVTSPSSPSQIPGIGPTA